MAISHWVRACFWFKCLTVCGRSNASSIKSGKSFTLRSLVFPWNVKHLPQFFNTHLLPFTHYTVSPIRNWRHFVVCMNANDANGRTNQQHSTKFYEWTMSFYARVDESKKKKQKFPVRVVKERILSTMSCRWGNVFCIRTSASLRVDLI